MAGQSLKKLLRSFCTFYMDFAHSRTGPGRRIMPGSLCTGSSEQKLRETQIVFALLYPSRCRTSWDQWLSTTAAPDAPDVLGQCYPSDLEQKFIKLIGTCQKRSDTATD